jgi:hypothetical protein
VKIEFMNDLHVCSVLLQSLIKSFVVKQSDIASVVKDTPADVVHHGEDATGEVSGVDLLDVVRYMGPIKVMQLAASF